MIGRKLGHFRILEKVGQGGMGVVYRAHDEKLDRDVAIKVLAPGALADDSARRLFRKEAMVLARLSHPNIGAVYDFDSESGTDFLAMELVPGVSLSSKISSAPLGEREAIGLGVQIAGALEEAHGKGIVHRDLKPANVIVTPRGEAKVLDFGLAAMASRTADVTETATGAAVLRGTLAYMAPEQFQGKPVDQRVDIYAMGVLLFEAVAGQGPYVEGSTAQLVHSIVGVAPCELKKVRPEISTAFGQIVSKCLDKAPERRYQSAKDLADALKEVSLGEPPARPAPEPLKGRLLRFLPILLVCVIALAAAYLYRRTETTPSVVVLPFVNATGDREMEGYGDGIAEEVINGLTLIPGLKVIARPTAFLYRGRQVTPQAVGRELNVATIVLGRLSQVGGKIAVQVDVIDAREGTELWGGQFQREKAEVQNIRSDIVRQVSATLRLKLSGAQQQRLARVATRNPDAYLLYLRGRSCISEADAPRTPQCVDLFKQALEYDPQYAQALAGLADAYAYLALFELEAPREYMPRARENALQALKLDDTIADAHTSLAIVKLTYDWDFEGAAADLRRAMDLNPGDVFARHWYVHYLEVIGRLQEANSELKRIVELDPLSSIYTADLALEYYFLNENEKVVQMSRSWPVHKSLDSFASISLALAYEQMHKRTESLATVETMLAQDHSTLARSYGAAIYARAGEQTKARQLLAELEEESRRHYVSGLLLAQVYFALGDNDGGFRQLEKGYEQRSGSIVMNMRYDHLFDSARNDPRYKQLLLRYISGTDLSK